MRAVADGKPALGVGIVYYKDAWCTTGASGYNINITALQGDKTSGYMNGSDSWEKLVGDCEDLKTATSETIDTVAQNYPAFNYCRKYGETNNLTGDLKNGWYLSTVAELYTIYQNKTIVEASLSKAGGRKFDKGKYWSCCQTRSGAQVLNFNTGNAVKYDKSSPGLYVCSVRAFN